VTANPMSQSHPVPISLSNFNEASLLLPPNQRSSAVQKILLGTDETTEKSVVEE
jgi:hypothetical protein